MRYIGFIVAAVCLVAAGLYSTGQQKDAAPLKNASLVTREAQLAIDQGLAYLARNQHFDGSFGTGRFQGDIAVTSLSALALMAAGNQPNRGKYGRNVTRALEYVLSRETPFFFGRPTPGFLCARNQVQGPMYGHGFGTLFLAEAYGMVHSRGLRKRLSATLRRAVKLIVSAQNREGGWRYRPFPENADISVTVCQIMALRAARNAGISVPRHTVDRCIQYVKDCQNFSGDGGFRYMRQGGGTGFARTAAGVTALFSAGKYKGPEVEKGLAYLRRCRPGGIAPRRPFDPFDRGEDLHFYYGHYYAVQAMWTAGGRYWQEWYPAIRQELLRRRRADGSWYDGRICPHYCTAMACIILQMPNNYLPIFQR